MENYADLMFHEAVADLQKTEGTFEKYQTFYPHRRQDAFNEDDIAFFQNAVSFYVASVTPDGWPYIQHRGGPRGFVKVTGPNSLACADYPGNRQFITQGNLREDSKVSLFFMDYARSARLKLQGRASLIPTKDASETLTATLRSEGEPEMQRVFEFTITAMDWNCPKYIPRLYSEDTLRDIVGPQMAALQQENAALKDRLAKLERDLT